MKKSDLLTLARSRGVRVFTPAEKAADLLRRTEDKARAIALQSACLASARSLLARAVITGKANGFTLPELRAMEAFELSTLSHLEA